MSVLRYFVPSPTMSEENLNFDGYACSKALSVDSTPEDCRKLYAAWSETYDQVCI